MGNTYIVLTARTLNADLFIVARAGSDTAEQRMTSAGANRVVSPYRIDGRRMALQAAHPMLVDFVDHLAGGGAPDDDSLLAEFLVADDRVGLAGQTIAEAYGPLPNVHVLGLEHHDGRFTIGPSGDTLLAEGDRLMLYGQRDAIEQLSAAAKSDGD